MAKAKSEPKQKFGITAEVVVDTQIEIEANNFDEALAKAKELKFGDFVDVVGELWDVDVELTTITKV